jgi:hypothetical protein
MCAGSQVGDQRGATGFFLMEGRAKKQRKCTNLSVK